MAVLRNNVLSGISGMLGGTVVFRQLKGKTIVANKPAKSKKPPSEKQSDARDRFKSAHKYARAVTLLPKMKKAYLQGMGDKFLNAHSVAVADYLTVPIIHDIDVTGYKGNTGDEITVEATDDFCVVLVKVTILDAAGKLIENGDAAKHVLFKTAWTYKTTSANNGLKGTTVRVEVSDLPGNKIWKEVVLQ